VKSVDEAETGKEGNGMRENTDTNTDTDTEEWNEFWGGKPVYSATYICLESVHRPCELFGTVWSHDSDTWADQIQHI
jgi:hypothetical protein